MNYEDKINSLLRPTASGTPLVLDLFAGCGGLALGFESQGFETFGFEMNSDACASYNRNLSGKCEEVKLTPDHYFPKAQVVIGGPPCQPFSVGGHQKGIKDSRDGFPVFISAIEQAEPDIWMFENVRGLLYQNRWYLDKIIEALETLGYITEYHLINAVNYGVPQNRERLIVVGHKGKFSYPAKDCQQVTAGDALGHLAFQVDERTKFLTPSMDTYVAKYELASKCINPRDLYLHKPARTITCRNLAGATGDMQRIRLPDGRRKRLNARESARLQSFPDWFEFIGNETSIFNQIGNAVPPLLAHHIARSVRDYLNSTTRFTEKDIRRKQGAAQQRLELNYAEMDTYAKQ